MKSARMLMSMALVMGVASSSPALRATPPTTAPAPSIGRQADSGQSDQEAVLVQAIHEAADPSVAIAAYADAQGAERDNPALKRAYVQRMVDFGLPEMAEAQAQDLIKHDPQDGLGWAVAAYMSAKRDQSPLALSDIVRAVKYQPGDPFVLRTAAQVIAWYDERADKGQIPDELKGSIQTQRKQLAEQPVYSDAYLQAVGAYQRMARSSTTEPAAGEPQAGGNNYGYTQPQNTPYVPNNYDYQSYPNPYYSVNDSEDDYGWPGFLGAGFWWWPTWTGAVIFNNGFHHVHHHDGRFFHDGRGWKDSGALATVQGPRNDLLIRRSGIEPSDISSRGAMSDADGPIILRRADDLDGGFVRFSPSESGPRIIEPGRIESGFGGTDMFAGHGEVFRESTLVTRGRIEPSGPRFFTPSIAPHGFEGGHFGGGHFDGGAGGFTGGHGGGFVGGGGRR